MGLLTIKGEKYKYAEYKAKWLSKINLARNSAQEAATARTTKLLQEFLKSKYKNRIKVEARAAEGMTLRFDSEKHQTENLKIKIDSSKLQAFDVLDLEEGCTYKISLSDAFAEFFKDVLKALLDSRVKKLYVCMRNQICCVSCNKLLRPRPTSNGVDIKFDWE